MTELAGLLTGAWVAATSPLLVATLGLPLLPPAFGLLTALQGVAALAGPPLAGRLAELTGDRGSTFTLCGALLLTASLMFGAARLRRPHPPTSQPPV